MRLTPTLFVLFHYPRGCVTTDVWLGISEMVVDGGTSALQVWMVYTHVFIIIVLYST